MREVAFGTLFEFIRNGLSVKQDKSGEGLPITRIETISQSKVDPSRVGFAGLSRGRHEGWLLKTGDILFSHINSVEHIGKCAVYQGEPSELVHGMNLLCLRCDPVKADPRFISHLIRAPLFRSRLTRYVNKAVNQASVSIFNLKGIRVSVPEVAEQERIAAVLDHVDALRVKRREAIDLLDGLAQSIFSSLFGPSADGRWNWPVVELRTLTSLITKGTTPTSVGLSFTDEGVPFLRVQNLHQGTVDLSRDCLYVSPESHAVLGRSTILPGDVLVSIAGTIGRSAVVPSGGVEEMNCNQAVAIVRLKESNGARYIREWLTSEDARRQIRSSFVTGTISNLSLGQLGTLKVPVPPAGLQKTFVALLAEADAMQTVHRSHLAALDELFTSLQQRAFSGALWNDQAA